jgi:hypothetical protein
MAVKNAAGGTKKKDATSAKKATGTKKTAATASAKSGAAKTGAASGKAAPKKAGAAVAKLSSSQSDLLTRIGSAGDAGYRNEKKAEQRSLDSLQEKKLIKKGARDKATGTSPYTLSNAGKKHLASQAAAPGSGSGSGSGAGATSASSSSAPASSGSPTPPSV